MPGRPGRQRIRQLLFGRLSVGSLIGCVRSGKQADSLACVYVKKRCATVTGIVDCLRREPDGDVHIELRLDRAWDPC